MVQGTIIYGVLNATLEINIQAWKCQKAVWKGPWGAFQRGWSSTCFPPNPHPFRHAPQPLHRIMEHVADFFLGDLPEILRPFCPFL